MACSGCGKRATQNNAGRGMRSTSAFGRQAQYANNDFELAFYIGDPKEIIGEGTELNYGYRATNSRVLVHKADLVAAPKLFSDKPKEIARKVKPVEEVTITDPAEEIKVEEQKDASV